MVDGKGGICRTCGNKGFEALLLCCSKCQISEEHRYCLAQIPAVDDEDFTYTCAKCTLNSGKQTSFKESFRSAYYSASSLGKTCKKQRIEPEAAIVQELKGASSVAQEEAEVPTPEISVPFKISVAELVVENVQSGKNENETRPSLISQPAALVQDVQTCEDNPLQIAVIEPPVLDVSQPVDLDENNNICHLSLNSQPPPFVEAPKYVYAQPIIHPAWRGCFQISKKAYGEFVAHLSNKACLQVIEAAKLLPVVLSARMLPRLDIWPKSFRASAPTDEHIALYFFPGKESVVKDFDSFIRDIITSDLALEVLFDSMELLIFSSRQLPSEYMRFMGKYYLWGVFRGRKDLSSREAENNNGCTPLSAQGNTKMSNSESVHRSPLSPLSVSGSHSSGSLCSQ